MKIFLIVLAVVGAGYLYLNMPNKKNVYYIPQTHMNDLVLNVHENERRLVMMNIVLESQYKVLRCIELLSRTKKEMSIIVESTSDFFNNTEETKKIFLSKFPDNKIPEIDKLTNEQKSYIATSGGFTAYALGFAKKIIFESTVEEARLLENSIFKTMDDHQSEINILNKKNDILTIDKHQYLSLVEVCINPKKVCSEKLNIEIQDWLKTRERKVLGKVKKEAEYNNVVLVMGRGHSASLNSLYQFSELPTSCK